MSGQYFAGYSQYCESILKIGQDLPLIVGAISLTVEDVPNVIGEFSKITGAPPLIVAKAAMIVAVALLTFGEVQMMFEKPPKIF